MEALADRYGVRLEREDEDPAGRAAAGAGASGCIGLLERAARFYAAYLWESRRGGARRANTSPSAGSPRRCSREFRVGYAPSAWDRVLVGAQRERVHAPRSWSTRASPSAGSGGDALRPLPRADHVPAGRRCAGACSASARARWPSGRPPKYLNTSESELYHKGRQLFGIDVARRDAAKSGRIVVVEGYTDVLAMHQAGIRETVAIMGTALTEEQVVELARRLAKRVMLALDADRAGQEAMLRAARAGGGLRS